VPADAAFPLFPTAGRFDVEILNPTGSASIQAEFDDGGMMLDYPGIWRRVGSDA
jgi:hypothetical protein